MEEENKKEEEKETEQERTLPQGSLRPFRRLTRTS